MELITNGKVEDFKDILNANQIGQVVDSEGNII